MGRQASIVRLGLEQEAADCRERGLTLDATTDHLNDLLAGGGIDETVSRSAVARYITALDNASVSAAHTPHIAQRNAELSIDVWGRILGAVDKLDELLAQAEADRAPDGGRNWPAVLGVMRETREQIKMYADVLDRVYSAESIQRFQAEVMEAIGEGDAETARRVRHALSARHELRRAALHAT